MPIDVVVPCYNYGRYLRECVESVLSQEGVTVRVLILDDASTDDTPTVGQALAADPRVTFRRHATNQGHIATYNEGLLGWCAAPYSLLLSADDALTAGALRRATALLDAHPSVGFVYGRAEIVGDRPMRVDIPPEQDTTILSGGVFLRHCCLTSNPVPTPTAVVRTALQQEVGGYNPALPHSGDMAMWMHMARHAEVGILKAVQARYRWHGRNMGTSYYASKLGDLQGQIDAATDALAPLPETQRIDLWQGLRARISAEAFWAASKAFDAGDQELCARCLRFAEWHSTELYGSPRWVKLHAKRLMGQRLWRVVQPRLYRLRGRTPTPLLASDFVVGGVTGWWPNDAPPAAVYADPYGLASQR